MTRLARISAVSLLCGAALASTLASTSARAQISNGNGPIDVTADQLEMVDAQHLAIWRGNVEALQNGNRLVSDIMNVYFQGNGTAGAKAPAKPKTVTPSAGGTASVGADWGAVKQLVADGHVFFVGDNQTARGNHAVYDLAPDTITMTGDVVVVQGDNVIKGDKLVIQVKTGHADVISNTTGRNKPERVRGVFYNANQSAPAGQAPGSQTAPAK